MNKIQFRISKFLKTINALKILQSPWTIGVSALIGIYIGLQHHQVAENLAPLGNLYLSLLKMCVLPILISAILMSIGKLMKTHNARRYIQRILFVFPFGLLLMSAFAALASLIAAPGKNLDENSLKTLGVLVNKSGIDLEMSLTGAVEKTEKSAGLMSFLFNLIPDNIFEALSQGQALRVLFFAIVFGTALGLVNSHSTETMFELLDSIYNASKKMISWLTLLLPVGLCCLLAAQIAKAGLTILFAMSNFVGVVIVTFGLIYLTGTLIIWWEAKCSFPKVLSALKDPVILALATSSSLACLPSGIAALSESLKFERQTTNLVLPLAITICRFGSVTYFAAASVFVAQLYNTEIGLGNLIVIVLASIFAGMATSGATGIVTLTMLNIVLQPLGLPLDAVLVLFIAIDPIIDPFRTLGIVHSGIAATSVIADLAVESQVWMETN